MSDSLLEYPWIISVDDHVVEPPSLWWDRLSTRDRASGPHVVRDTCATTQEPHTMVTRYAKGADGPVTDWWVYEDLVVPVPTVIACAGLPQELHTEAPISYADMRPGCYDPRARLADMDDNRTERSLCFPNMTRFCGQIFHEAKDKDVAMKCVRAYNDWMVEEWCAGSGGRLIPLCLIPLWDPVAAAAEIRRNAARGSRAITFPEMPSFLGLPDIHDPSGFWEPVFDACQETETLLCMHIGSGSRLIETSPHAPRAVMVTLKNNMAQLSLVEWLCSGLLAKYPGLKIVYSESQIGWIPAVLERLDKVYTHAAYADLPASITQPPSTYMNGRVFASFFDDETGLRDRDAIGIEQILFEIDYPHQDTTWPNSDRLVRQMTNLLAPDEIRKVIRTNALAMFGLPDEPISSDT